MEFHRTPEPAARRSRANQDVATAGDQDIPAPATATAPGPHESAASAQAPPNATRHRPKRRNAPRTRPPAEPSRTAHGRSDIRHAAPEPPDPEPPPNEAHRTPPSTADPQPRSPARTETRPSPQHSSSHEHESLRVTQTANHAPTTPPSQTSARQIPYPGPYSPPLTTNRRHQLPPAPSPVRSFASQRQHHIRPNRRHRTHPSVRLTATTSDTGRKQGQIQDPSRSPHSDNGGHRPEARPDPRPLAFASQRQRSTLSVPMQSARQPTERASNWNLQPHPRIRDSSIDGRYRPRAAPRHLLPPTNRPAVALRRTDRNDMRRTAAAVQNIVAIRRTDGGCMRSSPAVGGRCCRYEANRPQRLDRQGGCGSTQLSLYGERGLVNRAVRARLGGPGGGRLW